MENFINIGGYCFPFVKIIQITSNFLQDKKIFLEFDLKIPIIFALSLKYS